MHFRGARSGAVRVLVRQTPDMATETDTGAETDTTTLDDAATTAEAPAEETSHPWSMAGEDGLTRCWWPGTDSIYLDYHDHEWGSPCGDDFLLFENMCLEGFQAGLSWITILKRRPTFREAFAGFDFNVVAGFGETDVERLMGDAGIIRNQAKIRSTINNAQRAIEVVEEFGSLAAFAWSFEPGPDALPIGEVSAFGTATSTTASKAFSKELKRRGWSFVGPTTMHAFMQSAGMLNDHVPECAFRADTDARRAAFVRPVRTVGP